MIGHPREQEIKNRLTELPDNVQDAINHFNWAAKTLSIANKYQLQLDELDAFQQETMLIIVGLEPAEDYQKNLVKSMGISHELAGDLVAESNQEIFRKLQELAFGRGQDEADETDNNIDEYQDPYLNDDPYQENIMDGDMSENIDADLHKKLVDELKDEGIHIGEDINENAIPKNDLQNFVDGLLSDEDKENLDTEAESDGIEEESENVHEILSTSMPYQEEISDEDLQGVNGHRIDTTILKTQQQFSPGVILEDENINVTPNQEQPTQTLEKKLTQETVIMPDNHHNEENMLSDSQQKYMQELKSKIVPEQ